MGIEYCKSQHLLSVSYCSVLFKFMSSKFNAALCAVCFYLLGICRVIVLFEPQQMSAVDRRTTVALATQERQWRKAIFLCL